MKPPAPEILRKGAIIRIAGAEDQTPAAANAYAIAFVDLRYDDGHVERWLGSGELRDDLSDPVPYAELMAWATEVAEEHSLSGDLGMSFSDVNREALANAAVEVVYEWNATLPDFRHDRAHACLTGRTGTAAGRDVTGYNSAVTAAPLEIRLLVSPARRVNRV